MFLTEPIALLGHLRERNCKRPKKPLRLTREIHLAFGCKKSNLPDMAFTQNFLYADSIEPISRSRSDEVFFLNIEACPEPGSPDFGFLAGAYVHCYISSPTLREAELYALEIMQGGGWRPHRFHEWDLLSPDTASEDSPNPDTPSPRHSVQEAEKNGHVLVFHCWDIDSAHPDEVPHHR